MNFDSFYRCVFFEALGKVSFRKIEKEKGKIEQSEK